ncbi:hypothetical protein BJ970_007155 [Saccharopolyspora phatthalungensis]|uniref:Uncharacterized protein n=1 Tax=Saccharopolyspora phatthalungensis TaxID=664693 RepID=A0A840QGF2_9PSEU|nr:hypothetical protein [Saccharopolyspora phatthalungensis]
MSTKRLRGSGITDKDGAGYFPGRLSTGWSLLWGGREPTGGGMTHARSTKRASAPVNQ